MYIGGAEAKFPCAWFEDDVFLAKGFLEFFGPLEGAVGGGVVDNYDFPV